MGERGRKRRGIERRGLICLFLFLFVQHTQAQYTVKGIVQDSLGNGVFGNAILKDGENKVVAYHIISDENGAYTIETNRTGNFTIHFTALSYAKKEIPLTIQKEKTEYIIDVVLQSQDNQIDQVVIDFQPPIAERGDTIIFDADTFATGNEEVVEELLKKIPGLQVEDDGTIKVGNQEIEKVMIEGDDFFEKGYGILTKNMPSQPIDDVQVLKNYSNNPLLKGIENSDKVALNLTLKEDAKRTWFGNVQAGYFIDDTDRYEALGNLMNFGKKTKYYFLGNMNNIGRNSTGNINHLIRSSRENEVGHFQQESTQDIINLRPFALNFKKDRTNFNDAELVSLNAIFNPSEKTKIKTLGFFNWDEQDFFRNRTDVVNAGSTSFTNQEDYQLTNDKQIAFGRVDVTHSFNRTSQLESFTKYNNQTRQDDSDLLFNELSTIESLQTNNELFDQKLIFTKQINRQKAFILSGQYTNEQSPQQYGINQFLYEDLFPNSEEGTRVNQFLDNQMQFAGVEANYLYRKENGHLFQLKVGNQWRQDELQSNFSIFNNTELINEPEEYQNNTKYTVNDLYLKSQYRYQLEKVSLIAGAGIHQLSNQFNEESENPFFINPKVGIDWQMNEKNKLTANYSYNTTNASLSQVYDDYILTGFRSFSRGVGNFNQLNHSSAVVNYQFGRWVDRFFANTFILYSQNHDFFSTNSLIEPNFSLVDQIVIQDRELLSTNSNLDYFFEKFSTNAKLKLGYTTSNYKNIVNDTGIREVESRTINYGLELRSAFFGKFNFNLGSNFRSNQIQTTIDNSFTDNHSFVNLSFVLNEKFNFSTSTERYYFGNLENNNDYYFLDLNARYTVKKNKLSFALAGKNLFNTKQFRNFSLSDIGSSVQEYELLPRFILTKVEYRF